MYVVRVSKVSARGRDIGESYNDKLVCARDGRWSRWESVAKKGQYGARSRRGTDVVKKY